MYVLVFRILKIDRMMPFCNLFMEHTHTHTFSGLFPGQPGWAGTRKVNHSGFYWSKRWWGGSGISWTICKSFAPHSRQIWNSPCIYVCIFISGNLKFIILVCSAHYRWLVVWIPVCMSVIFCMFQFVESGITRWLLWILQLMISVLVWTAKRWALSRCLHCMLCYLHVMILLMWISLYQIKCYYQVEIICWRYIALSFIQLILLNDLNCWLNNRKDIQTCTGMIEKIKSLTQKWRMAIKPVRINSFYWKTNRHTTVKQ